MGSGPLIGDFAASQNAMLCAKAPLTPHPPVSKHATKSIVKSFACCLCSSLSSFSGKSFSPVIGDGKESWIGTTLGSSSPFIQGGLFSEEKEFENVDFVYFSFVF